METIDIEDQKVYKQVSGLIADALTMLALMHGLIGEDDNERRPAAIA
jgi:hypothetical protein